MKQYTTTYEVRIGDELITEIKDEIREAQDERNLRADVRYHWQGANIKFVSIKEN